HETPRLHLINSCDATVSLCPRPSVQNENTLARRAIRRIPTCLFKGMAHTTAVPQLESLALHCVHCSEAFTLTSERQAYRPGVPRFASLRCPSASCRRENTDRNVRVLAARVRDYQQAAQKRSAS